MGSNLSSPTDVGCTAIELSALKDAKSWKDSCERVYRLEYTRTNNAVLIKGVTDTLSFDKMLREAEVDVEIDFKEKTLSFRESPINCKKKIKPPQLTPELTLKINEAVAELPDTARKKLLPVIQSFVSIVAIDGSLRVLALTFETSFDGEFAKVIVGGLSMVTAAEMRALQQSGVNERRSVIDMNNKGTIRLEVRVITPTIHKKRKRELDEETDDNVTKN